MFFHLPPSRSPGADAVSRAFREAIEADRPEFLGATFGAIGLNGARLDAGEAGPTRIEFATVEGAIDLNDAGLDSTLAVSSTTVDGALRCRRSTFDGVRLGHVAFAGPVEVPEARFRRAVTVGRDVSFQRGVDAAGTTFDSTLRIRGSAFGDDASFADATFDRSLVMERLLAQREIDLSGASVAGLSCTSVEAATLGLDRLSADAAAEVTVEDGEFGRLTARGAALEGAVVLAGNDLDGPIEAARIDLSGANVPNADLSGGDPGRATLRGLHSGARSAPV